MVHDMYLDATADAFEQCNGQLASQVLLEVGESADHAATIPLVLQVQRIVPKRESETREQPEAREGRRLP